MPSYVFARERSALAQGETDSHCSVDDVFGADIAAGGVDVDVQLERRVCLSQPPTSPMPYTHYQYSDRVKGEG